MPYMYLAATDNMHTYVTVDYSRSYVFKMPLRDIYNSYNPSMSFGIPTADFQRSDVSKPLVLAKY